ncbi:AAA family ATPase [Sphingobacterium sp. PCS056]|uniref:McrB family protein n=1 Tax=Sphingobacterium sp. PCS056 TaxID=2931400 RepID=UPI0020104786|nr:AAA family ATPase [Sphingobacterium sp. PCS056]UPZ35817.1 AAA family ATPase [Sphingobacterium sp. PCS056]
MTLKEISNEFKDISFDELKRKYTSNFNAVFEKQKLWLCPVEEKVHYFGIEGLENIINDVIVKLKDKGYKFTKDDLIPLGDFTKNINTITKIGNFLNNFRQGKKLKDGSTLDLPTLFNQIKSSDNLASLLKVHGSKLHDHIDNLYSVVKHCQNPDEYLINYKFWKNIAYNILDIEQNYDSLCAFYRKFPKEQRHINFGTYIGTIASEIVTKFNDNHLDFDSNSKEYNRLQKLLHIPEYQNLIKNHNTFRDTLLSEFEIWLGNSYLTRDEEALTEKSILNYVGGIKTVDNDIKKIGISSNGLLTKTNISNIKNLLAEYRKSKEFQDKNKTGKSMYSNSITLFEEFMEKREKIPTNNITLNTILYGPPGTGKTYHTINKALEALGEPILDLQRRDIKKKYDEFVKEGRIVFTTFHQSLSYEDFIEGIKPKAPISENSPIQYEVKDGIFKLIANKASQTNHKLIQFENEKVELTRNVFRELYKSLSDSLPKVAEESSNVILETKEKNQFGLYQNSVGSISIKPVKGKTTMSVALNQLEAVLFDNKAPTYSSYEQPVINKILESHHVSSEELNNTNQNYVIIIDEINRGNVSQIFGELITLIETDKRIKVGHNTSKNVEALEVTLPYSQNKFSVPDNLFIIGTMNTSDRSVEALDSALRRRFSFEEMRPKSDEIANIRTSKGLQEKIGDVDLGILLSTINNRIEQLLDRDHAIGHSYFLDCENLKDLKETFYRNIIPLLQEYFFGDYAKIGLVLGNGFVRVKKGADVIFASFQYENLESYTERKIYEILDYRDMVALKITYKGQEKNITFEQAISLLLNQELDLK